MSITGLLIGLMLFCLLIWAARAIIAASNVPQPLATYIFVFIIIIGVLLLLNMIMGNISFGSIKLI